MRVGLAVISDVGVDMRRGRRWLVAGVAAVVVGLGFGILLLAAIGNVATGGFAGLTAANSGGNVEGLAALIFSRYLWAFELTSALLITAAIGAMVLAHRERFERRKTQRELSEERFRAGGHATPMPSPGVYARHNAVDVAALLPDGSYSELSVSSILHSRGGDGKPTPVPEKVKGGAS